MLAEGICLGCRRLVNVQNCSVVTANYPEFTYCNTCEDLALAHISASSMDGILARLNSEGIKDNVNLVIGRLVTRIRCSFESLRCLRNHRICEDCDLDGAAILRTMYDASLQVEYLAEPENANARAQEYTDFREIERDRQIRSLKKYEGNPYVDTIMNSPLRTECEPAIRAIFDKVERPFRVNNKPGKHRERWHVKNLRSFCMGKGREEEYDFIVSLLNGVTHSSPLALSSPPMSQPFLLLVAGNLVFRALGAALTYNKLILDPATENLIEGTRKNIFAPQSYAPRPVT